MQLRLLFSLFFLSLMFSGFSQITTVGLIGSASPYGWGADTSMVQSPDSAHLWSLDVYLVSGEAKFRADDAWTINWGSTDFPAGLGLQDGSNIPVANAGNYTVTFNSNTGEYNFILDSDIGIIGSATPGGWGGDTNMAQDVLDTNEYSITVNLIAGDAKFRANDDWAINWGAIDFPIGLGLQDGSNIPVPAAGKYIVRFNKSTGAYSFVEVVEFTSISLIGSATPGGWTTDSDLTKDANDPNLWKGVFTLVDGEAKFRANHDWPMNWGDTLFPIGIGLPNGGNIPIVAGEYQVSFNTDTKAYKFLEIGNYTTIGIIGSATPSGWASSTPMVQDAVDKSIWRLRVILVDGEAKFRADNDWVHNWGAGDFPSGIGEQDGANIPVPAGEYKITFNSTTGDYTFEVLVVYDIIGIIGNSIPGNNWDADVLMTKDAADEFLFVIPSIELLDAPVDGGMKFRANNGWDINWGAIDFPIGVGTQNGHNIEPVAGTYKISFNTGTGDYSFATPSSATSNLLDANVINVSPNPASDVLNIKVLAPELQGDVVITIFNNQGKKIMTQQVNIVESAKINVSGLNNGNYLVQLSKGKTLVGKKVVIIK